jgi:adenylate cyclase
MGEPTRRKTTDFLLSPRGRGMALGLLVAVVMVILSFLPLGHTLENQTLDLFYRLRPKAPQPADLLIVSIDEPSFQEIRQPWPWPRGLHAKLVRRLAAGGARLIIFDVIFADPTDPKDDKLLAQAFEEAGNVILGMTYETTKDPLFTRRVLITPYKPLRQAARGRGLVMVTPDYDGVVRRFHLSLGGRKTMPLVAHRLVRPRSSLSPKLSGLINYAGPARSIDTVSYYQIIDENRPLPRSRIRGRIVVVGHMLEASATPQAQADAFYTPFFAANGQLMSGMEIQANIINTLLNRSWVREFLPWQRSFLLVVVIFLGSLVLIRLKPISGLIFTGLGVLLLAAVSFGLFLFARFWMPPFLMATGLAVVYSGNVLGHYFIEAKEKRWLRQAFGRYVSPSVVEVITTHPERLELGGEEFETTVLFADLEGFTKLSETMQPHALIKLLNDYFSPMTQIILRYQGTLDKYIGDAIMALWGAPVPLDDHALRACRAALEMEKTMAELQEDWRIQGLPPLVARIGVHSGSVVAGNVGSRERFNYTALGDTVNLASRLEGVNKVYGTRILLSDDTRRYLQDRFLVRELDRVQVKGRGQPVTIYELIGNSLPEGSYPWLDYFAAGLQAYRSRQWEEASQAFNEVLRLKPQDRPTQVFLGRCRFFSAAPPPADWQGVFVLNAK